MNPQLTCSQRQWLHSSVGRAPHRYGEATGSNPVEVLIFFSGFFTQLHKLPSLRRSFLHFHSFPQFIYDLFHISLTERQTVNQMCKTAANLSCQQAISRRLHCYCRTSMCDHIKYATTYPIPPYTKTFLVYALQFETS